MSAERVPPGYVNARIVLLVLVIGLTALLVAFLSTKGLFSAVWQGLTHLQDWSARTWGRMWPG
ncbi:hypothetical protein [Hamadaea tsunoensis]|uniref:hypothetical protein n=1 Tax=Hamadaea tsunoensis TaxID=53368 RepID=UPI0004202FEE|nr:hypothetical protein [Hamadaea tsunoensis]